MPTGSLARSFSHCRSHCPFSVVQQLLATALLVGVALGLVVLSQLWLNRGKSGAVAAATELARRIREVAASSGADPCTIPVDLVAPGGVLAPAVLRWAPPGVWEVTAQRWVCTVVPGEVFVAGAATSHRVRAPTTR